MTRAVLIEILPPFMVYPIAYAPRVNARTIAGVVIHASSILRFFFRYI